MKRSLIALMTALLFSSAAYAQSDEDSEPRKERRGPPEVAIEACSSAVQGDPCSFEDREGDAIDGTCEAPDDKPLACRPEGKPPKRELKRK